jgi:hypothetical protein
MIYCIYQNNGRGLGFSEGLPNGISLKSCSECIKEGLKTYFVPEAVKSEVVIQLEPEAYDSKTVNVSKSKNPESKVITNSESKTPKTQVLKNWESGVLNPKLQRRKTIVASWDSRPNGAKPNVLNEHKPLNFKHKAQKKTKFFRTNPKGPIKVWVPNSEILDAADLLKRKGKAEVMVLGQWLLTTHDKKKVYVPNPNNERGRNYGIWRKPDWQNHWYVNYWQIFYLY